MGTSMRMWTGGILAAVGSAAWAWTLTMLEPATFRSFEQEQAAVTARTLVVAPDVDDMVQMVLLAKDLRWAALVLTLGGLLILLKARAMVVLGGMLWLAADVLLDRMDVRGWIPLVLCAVILFAVVALAWWRSHSEHQTPSSAIVLIYSGVAAALAPVLMTYVSADVSPYRPGDLLVVGAVVSLGLAVAAVAVALTAVPDPAPGLAPRALALAALVISPSIATQLWFATHEVAQEKAMFLVWAAAPILLLGCVVLVKGQPRGRRWLGFAGVAIAVVTLSYVFIWIGIVVSYSLQYKILPLIGDRAFFDGYQFSVAGFGAGLVLGLIALAVPRRAMTPRTAVGAR